MFNIEALFAQPINQTHLSLEKKESSSASTFNSIAGLNKGASHFMYLKGCVYLSKSVLNVYTSICWLLLKYIEQLKIWFFFSSVKHFTRSPVIYINFSLKVSLELIDRNYLWLLKSSWTFEEKCCCKISARYRQSDPIWFHVNHCGIANLTEL